MAETLVSNKRKSRSSTIAVKNVKQYVPAAHQPTPTGRKTCSTAKIDILRNWMWMVNCVLPECRNPTWLIQTGVHQPPGSTAEYANDMVLIINTLEDLQEMLSELNDASQSIKLKMDISKTKKMANLEVHQPIELDNSPLEQVDEYVSLR
ncbi:hypothetical protein ILUMI_04676 [Ignelater luminosus]|uniref:Reverse transcriptase domain-containing protein n=1 Tax=Ignelater luminosus TaxID=2038154 RepID=A0A8K0DCE6_IGNLU|nr:hypothetical protein ILUMI_04676 [Ignelater luminosus]